MTEISIQPVLSHELTELADIGRQTFLWTFASGNNPDNLTAYLDQAFSIKQLSHELNCPGTYFYFARINNRIAGYMKLNTGKAQTEEVEGHTLEIERIYVDAQEQGTGVGKALFQFSLQKAKTMGADAIWLGVWEDNPKAIEFYARQGFKAFGEHKFTIGNDVQRDILMRLEL